jgi:hypothetical protein
MLKQLIGPLSLSLGLLTLSLNLGAAPNGVQRPAHGTSSERNSSVREKDRIMWDDEREGTDIFAIPLDESDIEDQVQINIDERKNPNDLSLPNVPSSKWHPRGQ